jgi:hypothetical protein
MGEGAINTFCFGLLSWRLRNVRNLGMPFFEVFLAVN